MHVQLHSFLEHLAPHLAYTIRKDRLGRWLPFRSRLNVLALLVILVGHRAETEDGALFDNLRHTFAVCIEALSCAQELGTLLL